MEFIRRMLGMVEYKPYKVQDCFGKKRVGLTASNFKDLKNKAKLKLNLENVDSVYLEDGTEVEDDSYLLSLPTQTVLIVLQIGEVWEGYISYLKMASNKIIENVAMRTLTINKIQELLLDPQSPELSLIMDFVHTIHSNLDAEHIEDDPDWFEGVASNYKNKTHVMRDSAKNRIRGYLAKTKDFASSTKMPGKKVRVEFTNIIDQFQNELKERGYYGQIFDRFASEKESDVNKLCDDKGWFTCQGAFDMKDCERVHRINPYASKDARVLFSTWNLDHRIEKSREILPRLLESIIECPKTKQVNWKYFFELLFTVQNLKLVDIRCHKKEKHTACVVDRRKVYALRKK